MRKRSTARILIGTVLLLAIPLIAMQFTEEVNWDATDFAVMGLLILGTGFLFEFLVTRKSLGRHSIAIGIVVLILLLLTWAELAVGIFGTPWAGS